MGSGFDIAVSCTVGQRCGSDPALLRLWCRPAAVALIQPLGWEPPYTSGEALKKKKGKKKKKKKVQDSSNTGKVVKSDKLY